MCSFSQLFPSEPCLHFSSVPYMPHARHAILLCLITLMTLGEEDKLCNFLDPLSLHLSLAQISPFFMCRCGQRVRSIASRCVRFPKILILKVGINPLTAKPIQVSPSQLLIQYILRHPAYLETVISLT